MQQDQVQAGKVYAAKVNDKLAPVRIDSERTDSGGGGWNATNLRTGKAIRIKSAQRLRNEITVPDDDPAKAEEALQAAAAVSGGGGNSGGRKRAKKKLTKQERGQLRGQAKADQANAAKRDEREASADGMTASERAMAESEHKGKKKAKSGPGRSGQHANEAAAKARARGEKKLSCIDAAAQVLADAGEPMTTKEMVNAMEGKGLWHSDAPTPHATLYSAMLREIQKKGEESRFRKVERGRFERNA